MFFYQCTFRWQNITLYGWYTSNVFLYKGLLAQEQKQNYLFERKWLHKLKIIMWKLFKCIQVSGIYCALQKKAFCPVLSCKWGKMALMKEITKDKRWQCCLHWVQTILLHWHRPQFHIHCCYSSLCISKIWVHGICVLSWQFYCATSVEEIFLLMWELPILGLYFSFIQQLLLMLNVQLNLLLFLWRVLRLWMEEQPPIWRVAVSKLNMHLWTAYKWWSPVWGLDNLQMVVLQFGGWASC